jgi:hypothetical protein
MASEHSLRDTLQRRARALAWVLALCPATALASNFGEMKGLLEFVGFLFLSPAWTFIVAALIVGGVVENPRLALIWLWVLGVWAVVAFAVSLWVLTLTAPGAEAAIPGVHQLAIFAVLGLVIACAWGFGLLIRALRSPAKAAPDVSPSHPQ